jgi:hypothetical protein
MPRLVGRCDPVSVSVHDLVEQLNENTRIDFKEIARFFRCSHTYTDVMTGYNDR